MMQCTFRGIRTIEWCVVAKWTMNELIKWMRCRWTSEWLNEQMKRNYNEQ